MENFNAEKAATSHPDLANWNHTKGNPFDFSSTPTADITCEPPLIKIASHEIQNAGDFDEVLPPIITTVKFNSTLKIVFETIKYPYQAVLIEAIEENSYDKEKYISGREYIQRPDRIEVKKTPVNPVTVYFDYPFNQIAEVTINPYIRNGQPGMDFGYIVWQISRAYAEIYKNRWEEFGVWGHAFEDLALEIMQIRQNNIITVYIGS